ncbi:MAG: iron-sulfur cluster assembly accessory protein [Candidatus Aenigmarchaeota archaeon]|nr:iron-sulfur cluster assembly accessory protein [Candidatus Aenigmarchaeota archaeon]
MQQYIKEDMIINDIVTKYPDVVELLQSYGLHCFGCHVNLYESIGMGARGHGIPDETIKTMIDEANEYLNKKENGSVSENIQENSSSAVPESTDMIKLTEKAAQKVTEIMKEQKKEDYGLRIAVLRGGCAGFVYNMDFEKEPIEGDMVIEEHGVKLFVDPKTAEHIRGTEVDYLETLQQSGFKINNPNAKSSCGCGKSHS